jgi:hypothetical protein
MDTVWLKSRVVDGILFVSSKRANACLVRDDDSLQWAEEFRTLHERHGCDTVVVDLSEVDFLSYVAIQALDRLHAALSKRSGQLFIGGVRLHVLGLFLVLAPHLGASNEPAAPAADSNGALAA